MYVCTYVCIYNLLFYCTYLGIFRDWSTIVSLLLRESDGVTSVALDEEHAGILLRLFVASAMQLRHWFHQTVQLNDASDIAHNENEKIKKRLSVDDSSQMHFTDWESLGKILIHDLPKLFVRYRDDKNNLMELSRLLICESIIYNINDQKSTVINTFLRIISELFVSCSDKNLLFHIAAGLRMLNVTETNLHDQISRELLKIFKIIMDKINSNIELIKELDWTLQREEKPALRRKSSSRTNVNKFEV